jgi:hypothetical protein
MRAVESISGMEGGRIRGGVNSTMIYCKNLCKCHNAPPAQQWLKEKDSFHYINGANRFIYYWYYYYIYKNKKHFVFPNKDTIFFWMCLNWEIKSLRLGGEDDREDGVWMVWASSFFWFGFYRKCVHLLIESSCGLWHWGQEWSRSSCRCSAGSHTSSSKPPGCSRSPLILRAPPSD